ncbi:MAG: right-handed parallel beta-helix repeat-containing protein [Planctomycetota bacterium]
MSHSPSTGPSRRRFLQGISAAACFAALNDNPTDANEPQARETLPPATSPRATSGDDAAEPNWNERLTVTVGPDNNKADLAGNTEKVLQAAVDYVARFGGGTVQILPGTYKLRNAVYLSSHVRVLGSGADSILIKEPSIKTKLAADSDWYDQEVTLEDAAGFQVGDGICLRTKNPHTGGITTLKRTLLARSGNRFKLDKALRENYWLMGESTAATLFPIFSGEFLKNVVIENITLDGNKAHNELLDGNYAGCVFLQDCNRVTMRKVEARNYHGDGLSWQICHDCLVEDCHSHDNTGLGMHPGSGSQRPIMRRNKLEHNDIGIFFCWGVKNGLAEDNFIADNRGSGVSIGHRDTDNLVRKNEILRSGKAGILFRPERGKGFAGDRNRIEANRIVDTGAADGIGIDVQGFTDAIQLSGNRIQETREPMQRIGVRLGENTGTITLAENQIEGVSTAVTDLRKAK